jgi:predicted dehydrogenase
MLNIGVIGCGYWGPNHIRNFDALPECSVLVCCDKDVKRLEAIETTTEPEELFRDNRLDAIVIATPVFSHYELTKKTLESGKHVLVEKPMTHSVETSLSLIKTAKENDLVLMVGHTWC